MGSRSNRKENEQIWTERVRRSAKRSGTLSDFCVREGISQQSLGYWKRKLGATLASGQARSAIPAGTVSVRLWVWRLWTGLEDRPAARHACLMRSGLLI